AAVGITFGATAIAGVALVTREGPSPRRLLTGFMQPLLACAVMAVVVWLVDRSLGDAIPAVRGLPEGATGAVAYVGAALLICRDASRELLGLLAQSLKLAPTRP